MKYLITGITGFVGPHLANLLAAQGHTVCGLVRSSNGREEDFREITPDETFRDIQFFYGNLTEPDIINKIFEENEFDGVFHLGAQSHPPTSFAYPKMTFAVNATGTINLADAIQRFQPGCRLMFCSTSEVYGAVAEDWGAIDEEFPLAPINPYAVSKAAADMYVRERAESCKLPFFVTRAFSHTGPRRGKMFSISSDAYQLIRVEKGFQEPKIRVGTLSSRRMVMDVGDCVRAYYYLMLNGKPGEAYNISGDYVYSIGELLDKMIKLTGLNVETWVDPKLVRPIDIPVQICNHGKVTTLTGWKPAIPIEWTLRDLLNYWRQKITK